MKKMIKANEVHMLMNPGIMMSTVIHNPISGSLETVFIVKDFNKNLKKLVHEPTVDVRSWIKQSRNAAGMLYMIKFGKSHKFIYHHWFDIKIHEFDLIKLSNQDNADCILVNESNKVIDRLVVPNTIKSMISKYIDTSEGGFWSETDYNRLVQKTMKNCNSSRQLWNYVSRMAS